MKPITATIIRNYIEKYFLIDSAVTGEFVPFKFNKVQEKLWREWVDTYGEEGFMHGMRELLLKARKEGFTSLVLAVFAAICMLSEYSPRFLEISYKEDATAQHFRRFKNFILSVICRNPEKWNRELERKIFKTIEAGSELVMPNGSSFYCGTASSKTGERGGTVQGILFSEAAHYPDTGIIRAAEIIDGTSSMVAVGEGMIIQETTANGFNHWQKSWEMAKRGELTYHPRFFSWKDFYTQEQFAQICKGFTDKSLIPQEFPTDEHEAFLTSGRPCFNQKKLRLMYARCEQPMMIGDLSDNGAEILFTHSEKGKLTIWKNYHEHKNYLIAADIAGGVPEDQTIDEEKSEHRAWSVAAVFDRASWEIVAELRLRCDPTEFGKMLCTLGEYYNWAIVAPESNNHGHATIGAMREAGYPHILRTDDLWPDRQKDYGFPTNARTKVFIKSAVQTSIETEAYKENSKVAVEEMIKAVTDDNGRMISAGGFLDCVITRVIGLYCLKFLSLDDTRRSTEQNAPLRVTSIVPQSKTTSRAGYR